MVMAPWVKEKLSSRTHEYRRKDTPDKIRQHSLPVFASLQTEPFLKASISTSG